MKMSAGAPFSICRASADEDAYTSRGAGAPSNPSCAIWSNAGCRLAAAKIVGGAAIAAAEANMLVIETRQKANHRIRRVIVGSA
jgi:hypothetical protein